jgi:hypothetical protein
MIQWASTVGSNTAAMVQKILDAHPHPEMGYRSCLGIIRLGQRYPAARVEAAAQRALLTGAVSYKSLESILRHCLDQQPLSRRTWVFAAFSSGSPERSRSLGRAFQNEFQQWTLRADREDRPLSWERRTSSGHQDCTSFADDLPCFRVLRLYQGPRASLSDR